MKEDVETKKSDFFLLRYLRFLLFTPPLPYPVTRPSFQTLDIRELLKLSTAKDRGRES